MPLLKPHPLIERAIAGGPVEPKVSRHVVARRIQIDEQPGPGTEFKRLANALGVTVPTCGSCGATLIRMNALGVDGCRAEFDALVSQLRENAKQFKWDTTLMAAVKVLTNRNLIVDAVRHRLNPADPLPWMLRVAIRRAVASTTKIDHASESLPAGPSTPGASGG